MENNAMTSPETDFTLPSPEEVGRVFTEHLAQEGGESALSYLYDMALTSGYVRTEDIARNICWTANSPYGPLEITINLSKPEKDPRAIAAAAQTPQQPISSTDSHPAPQCAICWENEGWPGSEEFPAKPLLRIAPIKLGDETWGLQYSPYAYFPEHCIALSREHRPMKIDRACFARLLDFVDQFPCYFIGSNADLPIVGGSILNHDHFQGGRHEFPLMRAPIKQRFVLDAFPQVACGIVDWPASTVRLESADRSQILDAATAILTTWQSHDDESNGILSRSEDGTPHNTVSPIVRKTQGEDGSTYVFDLVLRNNRTTEERPWGLFHPSEDLHPIKKENIGLIEIMGLAILPPRLARQLPAVQQLLHVAARGKLTEEGLRTSLYCNPPAEPHAAWALELFARRLDDLQLEASYWTPGSLSPIMENEVGRMFARVLEDTGVFKANETGNAGWQAFLAKLND